MDKKELSERLQLFRKGEINWLDIARDLEIAVDQQIPIDGNYISKSKLEYILRGYKAAMELGIISDPRILDINPYLISYLDFLKKNLKTGFKEIMEGTLSKKYTYHELEKIGRESQGCKWKGPFQMDKLRRRIIKLTEDLTAIKDQKDIRDHLANECNDLEHALRCIFDEEFRKAYAEKKEIKV
jgi:hypothetical protein